MNREDFLDTVTRQYSEEIHAVYVECESDSGRNVDYEKLNIRLRKLMTNAKVDGLSPKEYIELVKHTIPQACDHIAFTMTKVA